MLDDDRKELMAALEWQLEMGVDEAIGDVPVDRTQLPAAQPKVAPVSAPAPPATTPVARSSQPAHSDRSAATTSQAVPAGVANPAGQDDSKDAREVARAMAANCDDLDALRSAIGVFEFCDLKNGAQNLVFSDGNAAARVMIVGEAPGRDEDKIGRPFVGKAGRLLDRMFECIGLSRASTEPASALYITNVTPWRPPSNRDPTPAEVEMLMPFVEKHVELAAPEILVLMGNTACSGLLGRKGITRLRGNWTTALGRPVMPMFHPAALLRDGLKKRDSWSDLLMIEERLAS